jgi:hypothetical protein
VLERTRDLTRRGRYAAYSWHRNPPREVPYKWTCMRYKPVGRVGMSRSRINRQPPCKNSHKKASRNVVKHEALLFGNNPNPSSYQDLQKAVATVRAPLCFTSTAAALTDQGQVPTTGNTAHEVCVPQGRVLMGGVRITQKNVADSPRDLNVSHCKELECKEVTHLHLPSPD